MNDGLARILTLLSVCLSIVCLFVCLFVCFVCLSTFVCRSVLFVCFVSLSVCLSATLVGLFVCHRENSDNRIIRQVHGYWSGCASRWKGGWTGRALAVGVMRNILDLSLRAIPYLLKGAFRLPIKNGKIPVVIRSGDVIGALLVWKV